MGDSKSNKESKKINIKNKKEATKLLNKKNSTIAKKSINKVNSKKEKVSKVKITENKSKPISNEKLVGKERKVSKKVSTAPKTEKKKSPKVKKKEEIKLVLPKEWQQNSNKNKKTNSKLQKSAVSNDISTKLKESIFEEVDIRQSQKELSQKKEKRKKYITLTIIMSVSIIIIGFILIKYKDKFEEKTKIYSEYFVGEKYMLNDGTNWYVIEDSPQNVSTVKLLKEYPLDINKDKKLDSSDKDSYYSNKSTVYDKLDNKSIAYRLNNEYKEQLEFFIGKIEDISLLTSKEFVKLRDKMGYGYEWNDGNWLANKEIGNWWVISSQKDKIYAVSATGTYKLYNANDKNYVRPVITVKKDILKK